MSDNQDFFRTPVWYPVLAEYTWKTRFLRLEPEELELLSAGKTRDDEAPLYSPVAKNLMHEMEVHLSDIPGNAFVFVDNCAPTDTERYAGKGGAV